MPDPFTFTVCPVGMVPDKVLVPVTLKAPSPASRSRLRSVDVRRITRFGAAGLGEGAYRFGSSCRGTVSVPAASVKELPLVRVQLPLLATVKVP